jgi:hypothetical protein
MRVVDVVPYPTLAEMRDVGFRGFRGCGDQARLTGDLSMNSMADVVRASTAVEDFYNRLNDQIKKFDINLDEEHNRARPELRGSFPRVRCPFDRCLAACSRTEHGEQFDPAEVHRSA